MHTEYCLVHGISTLNLPEPGTEKTVDVNSQGETSLKLRIPKGRAVVLTALAPDGVAPVLVTLHYEGQSTQRFPFNSDQFPIRLVVARDVSNITVETTSDGGAEVTAWLECDAPEPSKSFPDRGGAASLPEGRPALDG